jgi:hypothetical protein
MTREAWLRYHQVPFRLLADAVPVCLQVTIWDGSEIKPWMTGMWMRVFEDCTVLVGVAAAPVHKRDGTPVEERK